MRDDDALWSAFHDGSLPAAEWTHEAHLRVAYLYVRRYGLDEAHVLMRVGIIRLNAVHGLVETVTRGYHETLTRVWLILVAEAARDVPAEATSTQFLAARAPVLTKDAPLRHYSAERLHSLHARATFIDGDRTPLRKG